MANTLITPGNIADLSPDSYAVHPFDAMSESIVNLAGTLIDNSNLSDRAALSVSYTDSGRDKVTVVREGEEIPETATVFKNVTVPSMKLAARKTASNEILGHHNSAGDNATRINMQLLRDLNDSADSHVFGQGAGIPEGVDLKPIGQTEGITHLGELTDNLDWLADALANIVDNGGHEEDAVIVASPRAHADLLKLKDSTNGNRPLIDTLSGTSEYAIPNATGIAGSGRSTVNVRRIAGVPILLCPNMYDPESINSDMYILDRPNLLVAATEATVAMSKDAEFNRDATSFRGTLRFGWKLAKPGRLSVVTVPLAGRNAAAEG